MVGHKAYSDARVAGLLAEYHRTRDSRLREEIVEQMRPLVVSTARKFAGREPQEDLESEGYVGLLRAIDRFSPDRGARFSTFATHLIAGQIRHYLRDRGHLIRQPAWLQELNARVASASRELEQRLEREPTIAELAAATNLTEEAIEEMLSARQAAQIVRLESSSDREEEDYLDVDPEKLRSRDYHTFELPVEDRIVLDAALAKLKELERKVLYYFFYQDFSQSEIARQLGISCNYTGYVLRNGLKHMRERLPLDRMAEFVPLPAPGDRTVLDPLTGIYNRAYFEHRLSEEISRARQMDRSVSVCCLQMPAGCPDATVQAAAKVLKGRTRKADILARTGPCEFAVIFPDTGEVAGGVSLRLANLVQQAVGGPIHVASATYPSGGRTGEQLYSAARAGLLAGNTEALATV